VKTFVGFMMLLIAGASGAAAHDTWVMAKSVTPQKVMFDISSGMNFPALDVGPDPARVAAAGWRLGDRTGRIREMTGGESSLEVAARYDGYGTLVAWVAFKPREIDLERDEVQEYLDEIGAPESLRRTWESSDGTWHETYTKYAKTFVVVGDGAEDRSCIRPLGTAVELVPLRDPTTVSPGEELVVRVLKNGYASEGQAVVALCGATGIRTIKYANKSGHVTFEIDEPGPWLFSATELRRQGNGTWTSDMTTMSFEAGAQR